MLRPFAAAVITAVTLALLSVQLASMLVDGGVWPDVIPRGACDVTIGYVSSADGSAGLRSGDVVDMPALDRDARLFLTSGSARAGSVMRVPATRDGKSMTGIVRIPAVPPWTFWLAGVLAKLIIYGVGSLVLWRGRDLTAAYFGISSLAISVAIYPWPSSILAPGVQTTYAAIVPSFAVIAALFFYLMIERLSRQYLSPPALLAARTIVFAGLGAGLVNDVLTPINHIAGGCANLFLMDAHPIGYMASLLVALILLSVAFFRASGEMRQRLRWIVVSTFVGFSGALVYLVARFTSHPISAYPITDITATAIPIGYAYAILRHRVIDVGFVLNRAIVFTAMTSLVVVVFALLSGTIERAAVGQRESVALQVAVALCLALSFNTLQKRVERSIDQLFFRKKHRAQEALARVADEAPFVHSADVLLKSVTNVITGELGARGVGVYHAHSDGKYERIETAGTEFPATVDVDDAAFVRLRTYLRDVNLQDVESALGKEGFIFPLAAQGRLTGALACAARASEEPYDPDEQNAIRALAVRMATVLESMRAREHAQLVRAIAYGTIDSEQARTRARELITDD